MILFCAGLICIYLLGFAATMRLTGSDLDVSLTWPFLIPILAVRAIFVGIKFIVK